MGEQAIWSVEDAVQSYAHWWREAGLHTAIENEPHGWRQTPAAPFWLRDAGSAPAAAAARPVGQHAPQEKAPTVAPADMPGSLPTFLEWLASNETQPEATWSGAAILPPAQINARLLVLIEMPDMAATDSASLLAPDQRRFVEAMLASIGLSADDVAFASLATRRPPGGLLDETMLGRLTARMIHYLGLARPQAAIILGDRTSRALIGTQWRPNADGLQDVNHEGGTMNAIALASLDLLMRRPAAKAKQRHLVARPLHGERISGWRNQIAAIAEREIDTWPEGREFALRPRMQAITLEVILRLVFGVEATDRLERLRSSIPALLDAASLVFLVPDLRRALQRPGLMRAPGNPLRRFARRRGEVDQIVYSELRRRRADDPERLADRDDLLSMLMAARDEDGRGMSDEELRDELITLLFAGHETTATALAWSVERLVRHPDALRRAREEAASGETAYLDAVIKESMRTRPVVFDTPRLLREPLELGGHLLPEGWLVATAIPLVHLSADVFPNPDRFEPERFLERGDASPVAAWMPFGGGRRRCVGARLALLELQTILATILGRCEFQATRRRGERQRPRGVTLTPARGARVVVSDRAARPLVAREGSPSRLSPATGD